MLQAADTRGVGLVRCNELDKLACNTRSCVDFVKYGHTVGGHPRPRTQPPPPPDPLPLPPVPLSHAPP